MPQDKYGVTPLMAACRENELDIARVLSNKRAAVNYQNKVCNYLHCFHNLSYSLNKLMSHRMEGQLFILLQVKAMLMLLICSLIQVHSVR